MRYVSLPYITTIGCFALLMCAARADNVVETHSSQPQCSPFGVLLRRDFNDIGWFGDCNLSPTETEPGSSTVPPVVGALGSFTSDELAHRGSVSADGVAAVTYRIYGNDGPFKGLTLAPFVQFDETHFFPPLPSSGPNSDTITPGGFIQLGLEGPNHWLNFFRVRDGEVYTSAGITSNSAVGEWFPVNILGFGVPHPLSIFTVSFNPELMVQYDDLLGGKHNYRLFSSGNSALRIGPQAGLWFNVAPTGKIWEPFPGFWERTFATVTYHFAVDTDSGRNYALTMATLAYNVSDHLTISGSYGYGNSEATGNFQNQFKVGLAAKF